MARGAVAALCVELLWELLGFFRSISHHLFPLVAVAKGSHFSTASAALIFILAALGGVGCDLMVVLCADSLR